MRNFFLIFVGVAFFAFMLTGAPIRYDSDAPDNFRPWPHMEVVPEGSTSPYIDLTESCDRGPGEKQTAVDILHIGRIPQNESSE